MPTLNLFLKHSRFFHLLNSSLTSTSNFSTHIFTTQYLHPSHHHGTQSLNTDTSSDSTTLTLTSSTSVTMTTFIFLLSAQPSLPDFLYLTFPNYGTSSHRTLKKWPVVNPFHFYLRNTQFHSLMISLSAIVFYVPLAWGWTELITEQITIQSIKLPMKPFCIILTLTVQLAPMQLPILLLLP